ncbi:MAG: hypothetical protein ACRD44_15515 [Bryobacteraceae bacterium]
MTLPEVFQALGEDAFRQQVRSISIGRLRSYQLLDRLKTRCHLAKLNTETIRKAAPRLWARLAERDEDLAADLSQAILVSNLEMIRAVLDFLGVAHNDGFFDKDDSVQAQLTEGWQQRAWDQFHKIYPEPVLLFYLNHLACEVLKSDEVFSPAHD